MNYKEIIYKNKDLIRISEKKLKYIINNPSNLLI